MPLERDNKPTKLDEQTIRAAREIGSLGRAERTEGGSNFNNPYPDLEGLVQYEPRTSTRMHEMTRPYPLGYAHTDEAIVPLTKQKAEMIMKVFPQLNYDAAYEIASKIVKPLLSGAMDRYWPSEKDKYAHQN
jgi:hypothetical protein